ncbi:uncharacterized protein LOC117831863 isoform X2 [Notolabrus celidotus]|nr:uncharacterized protein LOC117831863 isoform X2 [Notolabrus celidotus]
MTRWFSDHQDQLDEVFRLCDPHKGGSVHLQDFQRALMNLNAPCQQSDLHMLTQQLKNIDDSISYRDLTGQIHTLRLQDRPKDSRLNSEDGHQVLNPEKELRFVRLSVRLIPFDLTADHPANFEVVLLNSSRVSSLIRMIQERVGVQTSLLEVFRCRVPSEQAKLPSHSSLQECGFTGGSEETPPEYTVYYDYSLLFTDCPILNCDCYFT